MEKFLDNWNSPPVKYRPLVRWWWPGLDVDPDELKYELNDLAQDYFGGVEIQPFRFGGVPNNEKVHRFAPNPYYYEMLKIVCEEAQKNQMIVDLTIGSAWPPGGTQVSKDNSMQTLLMGTKIIRGGTKIREKIPEMQLNPYYKYDFMKGIVGPVLEEFYKEDFHPIATVAVRPIKKSKKLNFIFPKATPLDFSSPIDLSEFVQPEGILEWDAPAGKWQIFTIYAGPSGMTPMLDAKSSEGEPSLVVDFFNEKHVQNYLDGHITTGKKTLQPFFGKTLRALFTDSQEIACEWFWTPNFFNEFEKRRGYDVKPYLPVCFVPNRDNQFLEVFFQNEKPCFDFPQGMGDRIRYDWLETLSDLWAEKYCQGVSKWGEQYGLKHRIQTYGIYVDMLKAYGYADIPETEQLFAGGILDFLKIAGSAGIIYKKSIVSSETMVWRFREHSTTPLKWKVAADRLFVAGINQILYHGYPYFAEGRNYPGYNPWGVVSSNLNRTNTFKPFFAQMNGYVARGQYLLQNSEPVCNIAIFYPHYNYDYKFLKMEELVGGHLPGFDNKPASGAIIWFMKKARKHIDKITRAQQYLGEELTSYGYNYTHINEEIILNGLIENGSLVAGFALIKVLIFQDINRISLLLAQKIEKMVHAGIKVVFIGDLPKHQPGYNNFQENEIIICSIMENLRSQGLIQIENTNKTYHKNQRYQKKSIHLGQYLKEELSVCSDVSFLQAEPDIHYIHKKINSSEFSGHLYFFRSASQYSKEISVNIYQNLSYIYQFNLMDGSIIPLIPSDRKDNLNSFHWRFESYGSKMVLFSDKILPGFAPNIHQFYGELNIQYENGKYFSYVDQPNSYVLKQNNGKEIINENNITLPKPIALEKWDLMVNHRKIDGSSEEIVINRVNLGDWRKIDSIQFCSGPGTYKTSFKLEQSYLEHVLYLNLGKVHDVAEVKVNGILFSNLLVPPYSLDISSHLKTGENEIEITVTGSLRNRLVGYGFQDDRWKSQKKKELMPIGLFGPIFLKPFTRMNWDI